MSKDRNYYHGIRWDLIHFVAKGNNRVLDIGCGDGNTGKALKDQGKAGEVVGIEMVPEIAQIAETNIDRVICANVETITLPFSEGYFEYIIMGDVLEHLYDPWTLVNNLRQCLRKGGLLIASIPNIRNWRILRDLVFHGEWNYTNEGLLDDTHIRFFTRKSISRLFPSEYFLVQHVVPEFELRPTHSFGLKRRFNAITFGLFEGFLTFQYLAAAKKL